MDLTGIGTAEPVAFLTKWSISFATDKAEVTAFGDGNKVYVAGLPDASGDFEGWFDDATAQTYTAAVDGLARKFYLYPSTSLNTQYFWGSILPDFSASGAVDGAVDVKSSWNAASLVQKQG
jgi:hypothetical protein